MKKPNCKFRGILFVLSFVLFLFTGLLVTTNYADSAQGANSLIAEVALQEFSEKFPQAIAQHESDYSNFSVTSVEEHGVWTRIHLMSFPNISHDDSGQPNGTIFYGAVGVLINDQWVIFFEDTPEFESLKQRLPIWLSYLDTDNFQQLNVPLPVAVPALPWAVGSTWRLNDGLHDGDVYGLDFGVLPQGTPQPVYAVDEGEVVYTGDTCMIVRRPDGLEMYYQHISSIDISRWANNPHYVSMGDEIGKTTMTHGTVGLCAGPTWGHHLHFSLFHGHQGDTATQFSYSDYIESTLNEWSIVSTTSMEKNGQLVEENAGSDESLNNRLFHEGCPQHALYGQSSGPYFVGHSSKNCIGDDWEVTQLNQTVSVPFGFDLYSLNLKPGYSILLSNAQSPPQHQGCYSGDLWDMSKDYYPNSSVRVGGNVGSVYVQEGGCQCQNQNNDTQNGNTPNSCPDAPPPPDYLPPAPGPQVGETVKIISYANF